MKIREGDMIATTIDDDQVREVWWALEDAIRTRPLVDPDLRLNGRFVVCWSAHMLQEILFQALRSHEVLFGVDMGP